MRIAREPDDIRADDPALVLAIEGCDFLDGDLDRLNAMEARGVRSIQLTHYLVNETGDIQTAPPVHGGLTQFGADVVRRMNQIGVIVDVAHCSEDTVRGVVAATSKPILCTPRQPAGAGRSGWRTSALHQSGVRADGGGDGRRDRRVAVDADARESAGHDPPHVPRDRRGRDRSCRDRHGYAGRRGAHRDAEFLPSSGTWKPPCGIVA